MKPTVLKGALMSALILTGTLAAVQTAFADDGKRYEVTIRNAMIGQPLAPSLFATHDAGFVLFKIGGTASAGLAIMAETGNPGTLADEVSADANVSDTVVLPFNRVPPVMLPGESNSAEITAEGDAKYFTAVGMLAATNDAFYAVRGIALPKTGSITVYADAYDAGSEANTELLADIPGGGNDVFDDPAGGEEGYIHIHAGIHGVGTQAPEDHDWRNPVVEISITRLSDHD